MDAGQQERDCLLHVGAGHVGPIALDLEDGDDQLFNIDIASGETCACDRRPRNQAAAGGALRRAISAIFATTKHEHGVFYASGKAGPKGAICALPPGRRTARMWSTAASSPSTPRSR